MDSREPLGVEESLREAESARDGVPASSSEPAETDNVVLRSAFFVSALIGVVFALVGLRALFLSVVPEGEQPVLARDSAVEPCLLYTSPSPRD